MKKVTAKIDPATGKVEIHTEGYAGAECLEATAGLESGLGMDRACAVPTAEFYQSGEQEQQKISGS